ncbi:Synaptophysin [Clonorchis sinensis]|uniref:Synaptophysin n=1 Tax=Clonorchis sinensis TaxID=79923 RepID=A0A8T1MK23_CLOSI|nr:Synaptophysin [Clonorchis sinensis]
MFPPSRWNFDIFKEPRGFIKLIQIVFAICAFAITCDFSTNEKLSLTCGNRSVIAECNFSYPFRIYENMIDACDPKGMIHLYGDFSASAQFFVFTGVVVFLYCIAVSILYVFWGDVYESDGRAVKDFVVSVAIAIFWFIASAAWADGVQQLKRCTEPRAIATQAEADRDKLDVILGPTYGGLNASLVFGFANILLWASSLWFIWKETSWAKPNDSLMEPSNVSAADGSSI